MSWSPSLGVWLGNGSAFARVWAPEARRLEWVIEPAVGRTEPARIALRKDDDGCFRGETPLVRAGDLYRFLIDGQGSFPDPASRFQPRGVHGPSQVVDPMRFVWSDLEWRGAALEEMILYELHIGAFTPQGTFAAARDKLPLLRDLGITAVEVMPVADFSGRRNWGYDGVSLYAPARCYGTPDEFRAFINEAHRLGLAVHLDVVYNHLGPDGAYHGVYSPHYVSKTHRGPWGAALNFDGPSSSLVRDFFIENALHWIHEYHLDGLRLDATHAIVDESPRHFLAELSSRVHASLRGSNRRVLLIAEDVRNLACMVKPEAEGGWGLDAVWSDDFHHEVRRFLAGDSDGYFADFSGTLPDIAATAARGWFYCGQYAPYFGAPRGTDPAGIPLERLIFFLQNHDQVGNRAFGDRLNAAIDHAALRAAAMLWLLLPETPLLFMGQEWAASSPFQYFTDHNPELGRLVTEGRSKEFSGFAAFADPQSLQRIPDPQDPATFARSKLDWHELSGEAHAAMRRYYQALIRLRKTEPALRSAPGGFQIEALNDSALLLRRTANRGDHGDDGYDGGDDDDLLALMWMRGAGEADLARPGLARSAQLGQGRAWSLLLSSEQEEFAPDAVTQRVDLHDMQFGFARPGGVILKAGPRAAEGAL